MDPNRLRKLVNSFSQLYQKATTLTETPKEILEFIALTITNAPLRDSAWHGPEHWLRVANNAIRLVSRAMSNGRINPETVDCPLRVAWLFGLVHDSVRESEQRSSEHGMAAALRLLDMKLFEVFPHAVIFLTAHACMCHTIAKVPSKSPLLRNGVRAFQFTRGLTTSERVTVGLCLDADRLDLPRVGIRPDPLYMFDTKSLELL